MGPRGARRCLKLGSGGIPETGPVRGKADGVSAPCGAAGSADALPRGGGSARGGMAAQAARARPATARAPLIIIIIIIAERMGMGLPYDSIRSAC
jgi:hypothetical protein